MQNLKNTKELNLNIRILLFLLRKNKLTFVEIAEGLSVPWQTIYSAIKRLQKDKMVEKSTAITKGKRTFFYALTPKSKKKLSKIGEVIQNCLSEMNGQK